MENLSYYHIFYTAAKTGNISRAAEELFMSQPAVSKAIKNLEQQLNTTLFFRRSRGVSLTREGELLYRHIASAFSSIEKGELQLKRNQELEVGHLHIGVSTTLCKHIMLPLLQCYIQKNRHYHRLPFISRNCFQAFRKQTGPGTCGRDKCGEASDFYSSIPSILYLRGIPLLSGQSQTPGESGF